MKGQPDGNAFAIMSRTEDAMQRAGFSNAEIARYRKAAMAGDFAHLLEVTREIEAEIASR